MFPSKGWIWVAGMSLAACAGHDSTNSGALMQSALADAQAENESHAIACAASSTLSDVDQELDRHIAKMDSIMTRMDDARSRMQHGMGMMGASCSGRDFDHVSDSLSELHGMMSEHAQHIRDAKTLEDAFTECQSHARASDNMMNGMVDDLNSMSCMHP